MDKNTSTQLRMVGVVFDGDDTLWTTEPLYDGARAAAGAIVASCGLDGAKWEEIERQMDVENVERLGHRVERFPTSCVQAYEDICRLGGQPSDQFVARRIWSAAESVFAQEAVTMPSARETLERLGSQGIRLGLLTKGDPRVQEHRIDSSGLRDFFDVIEIVREKTPSTILTLVNRLGVDPEYAWMVGNSVRSDILPALAAGIRVIWIEGQVWEYERSLDHLLDAATATNLNDVLDLILK